MVSFISVPCGTQNGVKKEGVGNEFGKRWNGKGKMHSPQNGQNSEGINANTK